MSTITFDTYKFIKELETAGMPTVQAEALLKVQQEILDHSIDNTLATKADLDKVERQLSDEIKDVKADIRLITWMLGIVVGGVLMVALKLYFPV
jgi:hypothetical protein